MFRRKYCFVGGWDRGGKGVEDDEKKRGREGVFIYWIYVNREEKGNICLNIRLYKLVFF